MEFNPNLKPWREPCPNNVAGQGHIERPDEVENIVWQTRSAPPTEYENALAEALMTAFEEGIEELPALVERLNALGVRTPEGERWSEQTFEREMARLGG